MRLKVTSVKVKTGLSKTVKPAFEGIQCTLIATEVHFGILKLITNITEGLFNNHSTCSERCKCNTETREFTSPLTETVNRLDNTRNPEFVKMVRNYYILI